MDAVEALSGGQALHDFFPYKEKTDGSGVDFYDVYTNITSPVIVGSPTRTTAKPFTITEVVSTKYDPQTDGTCKKTFDNYDSQQDVWTYLDQLAVPPAASAGTLPDYKLENGTIRTASSASGFHVLSISYAMKNTSKTPNEIFTYCAAGNLDPTSGSIETKADAWVNPAINFVGIKSGVQITIPVALFHQHASDPGLGLLSTAAVTAWAPVIQKNSCFVRKFIVIPS